MLNAAKKIIPLVIAALMMALTPAQPVAATTLPDDFTEALVVNSLSSPTAMAFAPDGRLFITQQGGSLRVFKNGALLPTPFLTLNVDSSGERGLLGLAFDPAFETNNYLYVYYTHTSDPRHNRVSRFTADGDVVVPGSEVILLQLNDLSGARNHNGGAMHFGDDGKLYIAVGDNARGSNAQTLANLLGKMLRMNTDGSIPTDNPFYDTASGQNRLIWALGLRNPFTFSIDPVTQRLFINDVGQNTWEEVNDGIAGANYGWPEEEGASSDPDFVTPLYSYNHSAGCAITGGVFYRSPIVHFPAQYVGDYFFADYCSNWIRRYNIENGAVSTFASSTQNNIVDLDIAPDGRLYYLARGTTSNGGRVMSITYDNVLPSFAQNPADVNTVPGQSATFTCLASSATPVTYQWTRDNINIDGATDTTYTLNSVQLSDNGARFRCVATNQFGSVTSASGQLSVTPNQPPVAVINAPVNGAFYNAGDMLNFAGAGSDREDGTIPASGMTWEVVFHHDEHIHPAMPPTDGIASGSYTIDVQGHTDIDVWYRVYLTVTDSEGLADTTYVDVYPRVVKINIASNVPGLTITLDGQPQVTPLSFFSVVGTERILNAPAPQAFDGENWGFIAWSNGQPAEHSLITPASNTTYTVTWDVTGPPPAPILSAPGSNSQTEDTTPTFRWSDVRRAVAYEVLIDDDAGGSSPALLVRTASESFTPGFLGVGTYLWQVRSVALGENFSEWSSPRTLTIVSGSRAVPNRSHFTTATPTLTWAGLTWATAYEIQVDDDSSFRTPEFSSVVGGLSVTTTDLSTGRYFWRVRGQRGDGTFGSWSSAETVYIDLP
jgi:glucose/arabinose dehydrogenase